MKLHHACGVGDVEVPTLSDEEALALCVEAYRFWRRVATKNGWLERFEAVQVWLEPDGSMQDSLYVAGQDAVVVLDT